MPEALMHRFPPLSTRFPPLRQIFLTSSSEVSMKDWSGTLSQSPFFARYLCNEIIVYLHGVDIVYVQLSAVTVFHVFITMAALKL